MNRLCGWAGKILFVNLSDNSTRVEPTEKYLPFIGGRGINQWLLFNLLDRGVGPLDPEKGIRLAGPVIQRKRGIEESIISEGVVPGTIQVPGHGRRCLC